MRTGLKITLAFSAVAMSLGCAVSSAGAAQCSNIPYRASIAELASDLTSKGFTAEEHVFLLRNASARLNALSVAKLNGRARSCGIDSARAHIVGCLRNGLPALLRSAEKPLGSSTVVSAWGKAQLTVREAIFFGAFEGCLTAGQQAMFR